MAAVFPPSEGGAAFVYASRPEDSVLIAPFNQCYVRHPPGIATAIGIVASRHMCAPHGSATETAQLRESPVK